MGKSDQVIDEETLATLCQAISPSHLDEPGKQRVQSRLLARIGETKQAKSEFITVLANQGQWSQIAPKVEKKQLFHDPVSGTEVFLLRLQPGAVVPGHDHTEDEHCLLLEGEASFGDLHLKPGDYHLARKGSHHQGAYSQTGALLYIQLQRAA